MKLRARKITLSVLVLCMVIPGFSGSERALMRFPDVHGNKVVFVQGGDIWIAPLQGGTANRITIHDGSELFPKFSPNGNLIAFTGEYDGNSDVYVMNRDGGDITRVTFHPGTDTVVGWHPIKNKIIFRSYRKSHSRAPMLFMISPDGTGLEAIPIHEIAQGSFSPDGKAIAYNKVSRESSTWKRYKGGTAQDIYLYNLETKSNKKLTDFKGTDRIPMWVGNKIYFTSDRDRVLNLYSYKDGAIEQLTFHKDYDVRRPSPGINNIVYELGGTLWSLNLKTKTTAKIPIIINTDPKETRPYLKEVSEFITSMDLSPSGNSVLITARGEIFSVPKKNGSIKNLTESSGARDLYATWSPDGKRIAWISDQSGEYEIMLAEPSEESDPVQLTKHGNGFRHTLRWSPDGQKLAYTDQTLTLYIIDVNTKKMTEVDKAEFEDIDVSQENKPINDFDWSPDSQFITYAKMGSDLVYQLFIYSLKTNQIHHVSHGNFNDFNPVFTNDGRHLLFISNRRFNPTFCDIEWEMVYKNVAGIYALTLQRDGKPFLPLINDLDGNKEETDETKKSDDMTIDFDGCATRIQALPMDPGNYRDLKVNDHALFFLNRDDGDFNRFEFRLPEDMNLFRFDFEKRKKSAVIEEISSYSLSGDGASIAYLQENSVSIIDSNSEDSSGEPLSLSNLKMWIHPLQEWQQIFNDAWRIERDYYYDPNMHGIDWDQMKEKYGSLVPYASCRQDIEYLIGELIGELNTSHTYVYGGDVQKTAETVDVGMLGVDWEISQDGSTYEFGKIYDTPNWSLDVVPPLAGPGKNIQKGDLLLKVNGKKVTTQKNIYSYFQNLAGQQVRLTVQASMDPKLTRDVTVVPASSEREFRYQAWVETNRKIVDNASEGQIGYVHLPDTFLDSAVEFPKSFFALGRKKGIIVDGRFNGGGLDPYIFLSRLNRKPHSYWTRRYSHAQTSPVYAPNAHMVCLTNRQAGSGGDELPEEFQRFKMGPVIGTRTWGGLVGVSMFISLMDGGGLTAPDYRIYDDEGKWIVENEGVTPDIEVDLEPEEVQRGYDAQLQKGIEVLLEKIKTDPRPWPKQPDFPVDR